MRRKRRGASTASEDDPFSRLVAVIVSKPHWIMYTAEFASVDDALAAIRQLTFFEGGRFAGDVQAGVFSGEGGSATVLLGGELMADQMGEVGYLFSTQASSFNMRWEKKDEVTEARIRRSLDCEPPS